MNILQHTGYNLGRDISAPKALQSVASCPQNHKPGLGSQRSAVEAHGKQMEQASVSSVAPSLLPAFRLLQFWPTSPVSLLTRQDHQEAAASPLEPVIAIHIYCITNCSTRVAMWPRACQVLPQPFLAKSRFLPQESSCRMSNIACILTAKCVGAIRNLTMRSS